MKAWPAGGPKEVWRVAGGIGKSGVSISNGKLFTLVQKEGQQIAVAVDARTGKSLWERSLASAYRNPMGDGPRATPAAAGTSLFTFTGEGILTALKQADGSVLWSKNIVEQLGGRVAEYGMACSPLVVGKQVIVTVGAPNATVASYDSATGKLLWKAGEGSQAGYSSPALLTVGGRRQLVVYVGNAVLGIDHMTGKELWRYSYVTDYNCNIATPIGYQGQVFISSGENHGSAMLALKPEGERFSVDAVWTSNGGQSVLRNEWQTSIVLDGYIYGLDNAGAAGPITHLTCIDAKTGKRVWREPRFGKSNVTYADGKLFFSNRDGELVVVRATPKGFEEIGRKEVIGSTRQAPALVNGLLYLRDDKEIVCFDVRGR